MLHESAHKTPDKLGIVLVQLHANYSYSRCCFAGRQIASVILYIDRCMMTVVQHWLDTANTLVPSLR